jgi:trk system potassium uptake protein TrkA
MDADGGPTTEGEPVGDNRKARDEAILVCGLGRFGAATAHSLTRLGREVLAIDQDPKLVQDWSGRLSHVVEADSTSLEALEQLGISEFSTAVVAIGTSLESSVLTAVNLVDLGVEQIWAKALNTPHAKILERIGVHHVVYPEKDAGERVAHLVTGKLMDYIEFDDGFAIVKMRPPREIQGFTLAESKLRTKYGVTVVGIKVPNGDFTPAEASTRVSGYDVIIVSGHSDLVERFASRP